MLTSRSFRFIKPAWLSHSGEQKDFEVYSCHVSPDGSRLATAAGDGHVRIWSTDAVLQAGDPNYSKPAQLCHMSYHSGTIHTVRFSPNGRWLASGADDKIICIYHLDTNPPSHAASFGKQDLLEPRIWDSGIDMTYRNQRTSPCRELENIKASDWARKRRTGSRLGL